MLLCCYVMLKKFFLLRLLCYYVVMLCCYAVISVTMTYVLLKDYSDKGCFLKMLAQSIFQSITCFNHVSSIQASMSFYYDYWPCHQYYSTAQLQLHFYTRGATQYFAC